MGPVFFALLLIGLQACAPHAVQAPTLELHQVHDSGAHRIAFDASSRRLASGGLRGRVRLWSLAGGTELQAFDEHTSRITGLAWLQPDQLVSSDASGRLLIRDIKTGGLVAGGEFGHIANLAVSSDGSWLVVIGRTGVVKLSLPALEELVHYRPPSKPVAVAVDHAGGRIALSTRDGRVQMLDAGLKPQSVLHKASRDAHSLVFSPDDKTLLAGGWFKLLVWDLESNRLEERATEHLGQVISVDISPDGARWISLGRQTDSNFQLLDARSGRVERRFSAHALCGQQARFSPDGRYAASSADDGSVHIYDLNQPYRPRIPYLDND